MDKEIPEELINRLLESEELKYLSYFNIKAAFKTGLILYLAYQTLNMQLEKEAGITPPEDWPFHSIKEDAGGETKPEKSKPGTEDDDYWVTAHSITG